MNDFKRLQEALLAQLLSNAISISQTSAQRLVEYILLLHKWNQAYNLTSIRDLMEMIPKHLLDSLSISPYLQGPQILDVGTGAGFPGIPLAITHPHYHFSLLDSNGKKTRFLTQVKQVLAIPNISIIQDRVETFNPKLSFNTITSRAFGRLNDFLKKTRHLCAARGIFLVMKGQYPDEEINELAPPFHMTTVVPISIAGLNAKRHILIVHLKDETSC